MLGVSPACHLTETSASTRFSVALACFDANIFCWQLYDFMPNGGQVCVSVIESPTNSVHEMPAQFPLNFRSISARSPDSARF